ncbi:MAG: divergent polysaccharide deacetylase family protein [Pseudomonadota bacterium]
MPSAPRGLLLAVCLLLPSQRLLAEEAEGLERVSLRPMAGLIIDDLGDRLEDGLRAINLPGDVTYSILPQTTFSRRFAEQAHRQGKEVMLHQPMQAMNDVAMGPGGLSLHMTRDTFVQTLRANLASVPHARGVNNHMGSLLTRYPGQMAWLMDELQHRGDLFFVDSTTTNKTVAQKVALEYRLPTLRRNVFLDHEKNEASIRQQFARFIAQAKAVGSSLAIAHPYPETLRVLEQLLPTLQEQGVKLLPVSQLIAQRNERRERLWQASLSPSQRDVKSSKQ